MVKNPGGSLGAAFCYSSGAEPGEAAKQGWKGGEMERWKDGKVKGGRMGRWEDMQARAPALPAWNSNDGISIQDLCMCLNVD